MKDFKTKKQKKKGPRENYGFNTSKTFKRGQIRESKHMGARPRALGGHK